MTTTHWDRVFSNAPVPVAPDKRRVQRTAAAFLGAGPETTLLDIGCGTGEDALFFASLGAKVTAIDTSPVAIARLAATAPSNVRAICLDAFAIDRLGPFDAVYGSLILHHIEPFDRFADVLHRAVRPGGRAFFFENRAIAPLMWFRRHVVGRFGIPKYGDPDEHPLTGAELDELRRRFRVRIDLSEFMLFRLVSMYLLHNHGEAFTAWLDRVTGRVPGLRSLSYRQSLFLWR